MIYCHIAINFQKWKEIKNIESLINSTTSLIIDNLDLKKYQSKKHDLEIFFNLVGKQKMKKINYQFLDKNYPTNVLSFANLDEN
jgi:ssRNA-specific RNase YbeY (16S rRNA maturation enzyme)